MYCVERMEYFQLTKENVDDFVNGFGKRVFRIGEPFCGATCSTNEKGIEILEDDPLGSKAFIPFGCFIIRNFFQKQTFVLYEEQFQQMFSVID